MKKYLYFNLLLMLLLFANTATFAQKKPAAKEKAPDPTANFEFRFMVADSVRKAQGFDSIYHDLKIKLTYFYFNNKLQRVRTLKFWAGFNHNKQCWTLDNLPYGMYELEFYDIAFKPISREIVLNKPVIPIEDSLDVDSIPYTFQNGKRFQYTRGILNFAQTFIVYFKDGDPIKNKKTIEKVIPEAERVHKMKHHNGFYVTIPIPARATPMSELFYEQRTGNKRKFEGFYMGDAITGCIMRLQELPNVQYANPTFYNDEREPEMFDAEKIPKSNYLKRKELGLLSEDDMNAN